MVEVHLAVGSIRPRTACSAEILLSSEPLRMTRNSDEVTCPMCKIAHVLPQDQEDLAAEVAASITARYDPFEPTERTLVVVCQRIPRAHGWPCRNGCRHDVELTEKAMAVLAAGGDVLCDVCARHLAAKYPDAFRRAD